MINLLKISQNKAVKLFSNLNAKSQEKGGFFNKKRSNLAGKLRQFLIIFLALQAISLQVNAQSYEELRKSIAQANETAQVDTLLKSMRALSLTTNETIALGQELISKSSELGYVLGQARSAIYVAETLMDKGSLDTAGIYYHQASALFLEAGEVVQSARADFDGAYSYYLKGDFAKALQLIAEDLDEVKEEDPQFYNAMLRILGEINRGANNLEAAIKYLEMSIEHAKETSDKGALGNSLNRLGVVYYQDSQHNKAKEYLEQSYKIAQEIQNQRLITMNLNDMGELYFALKDYEKCIELYEIALTREMGDDHRVNTYNNVARLYWELKDYDKAIDYSTRALALAEPMNRLTFLVDSHKILAESHRDNKNYNLATRHYTHYILYKDSLYRQESNRQLQELETKYESEKKELQIDNLTRQEALERSRKKAFLTGLIVAVLLLIFVLILINRLALNKKQLERKNSELDELNATKDKFFSIIAHDLRSPMIGLQGVGQKLEYFIRKKRPEKLLEMGSKIDQSIDQLNHLLNNLLNWASSQVGGVPHHPDHINLGDLVSENIKLYKSLAESKEVTITSQIGNLSAHVDANAISTVIRNLLSNAIKFSMAGDVITITGEGLAEWSCIIIKDQGEGMDETQLNTLFSAAPKSNRGTGQEKGFGLGLKLCKEFVGKNGGSIEVESSVGKGTTFIISLPAKARAIAGRLGVA